MRSLLMKPHVKVWELLKFSSFDDGTQRRIQDLQIKKESGIENQWSKTSFLFMAFKLAFSNQSDRNSKHVFDFRIEVGQEPRFYKEFND
jgi:hypothetical protein